MVYNLFEKLLIIGITLLLQIVLTGCGSSDKLQLEKIYTVELGNKISTEAKAYLKDAKKEVRHLQNAKMNLKSSP